MSSILVAVLALAAAPSDAALNATAVAPTSQSAQRTAQELRDAVRQTLSPGTCLGDGDHTLAEVNAHHGAAMRLGQVAGRCTGAAAHIQDMAVPVDAAQLDELLGRFQAPHVFRRTGVGLQSKVGYLWLCVLLSELLLFLHGLN